MKTYTICGSVKFKEQMIKAAYYLETKKGFNVLQCVYGPDNEDISENEMKDIIEAHYKKIDMSDGIYVMNIDGYIGESVSKEIEYAKSKNKEILYHFI